MPLTPTQSGQLNPSSSTFFGSSCQAGNAINVTNGSGIFIPFSAFESYKPAVSGDVRELFYSIVDKFHTGLTSMGINSSAYKVSTNRSTSFLDETSVRRTYVANIDLNALNVVYDVKEET